MADKTSSARRAFDLAVQAYKDVLLQTDAQITEPQIRQYVISASVFLGHASFENFVRDLFDIFGKSFSLAGVQSGKLPKDLRVFILSQSAQLQRHYGNYQASGDERKLLLSLTALLTAPKKTLLIDSEQTPQLRGSEILAGKAYPSNENLERVFSRVGIANIFDATSAVLKADSALLLKGFADKRTELAHNAVMPGTSARDISAELEKLEKFVAALDRVSYDHLTKLVGQSNWYTVAA